MTRPNMQPDSEYSTAMTNVVDRSKFELTIHTRGPFA